MVAIAFEALEVQLRRRALPAFLEDRSQVNAALCDTQFLPEAECRSL